MTEKLRVLALTIAVSAGLAVAAAPSASAAGDPGCRSYWAAYDSEQGSGVAWNICPSGSTGSHIAVAWCRSPGGTTTKAWGTWVKASYIANAYCPGGWTAYGASGYWRG